MDKKQTDISRFGSIGLDLRGAGILFPLLVVVVEGLGTRKGQLVAVPGTAAEKDMAQWSGAAPRQRWVVSVITK